MKKVIYCAALLCAAVMVSCGGKKASTGICVGDESTLDSLSYAIGSNIGWGISGEMPEMKFDWEALSNSTEEALLAADGNDAEHQAAIAVLQAFFSQERPNRMTEFIGQQLQADSTQQPDFSNFDIFNNEDERKNVSKAYGCDLGTNLRNSRMPIQTYWVKKGLVEASAGTATMTADDSQAYIQNYFMTVLPTQNAEASKAWLAEVEKEKGVQKTESGLLYRIERAGDETLKPVASDIVNVDYEGTLRDGSVFDSSYQRGEPIEFSLQGVIPGWTEGLQYVGKGGKITLWIPAELAYGQRGAGSIGPNEALKFVVELHDIKSSSQAEDEE
ncbi:MAG: FKBP-type peptidyl-prolyl cis-trans isomerase [Alistipes sp.]|nr:FKBP-type peptidyl-prolyl cis-trans isomerase [Alistipes sp.]